MGMSTGAENSEVGLLTGEGVWETVKVVITNPERSNKNEL
jgi:hypothetical protein